jgi:flagellar biosynthetic protein FliR
MDTLPPGLEPLIELARRQWLTGALAEFHAFTLVLLRLSGLMTTAPVFRSTCVPLHVRVLLVFTLALLVTPSLPRTAAQVFERLDLNHNGRLEPDELPPSLHARCQELRAWAGKPNDAALAPAEFRVLAELPASPWQYVWASAGEYSLGLVVGLGILTILSSLQLAGQLIDQQTGLGLGEVFNPELNASGSLSGGLLYLFGTTCFLLLGGHLLAISALLESFRTLPIGHASVSIPAIEYLSGLVHQSLALALQVALPVLASMAVVNLTLGFLSHTVPQLNVLNAGFPIKLLVGLAVLGLAFSGAAEAIARAVPEAIEELHRRI